MSKTWKHYDQAARHYERAAQEFRDPAKYHETEEHEKGAHHAYLVHGHDQHAQPGNEAAKLHTAHFDSKQAPAGEQEVKKKSAA